jgi:multidrug resistance efflux pump
MGKWLILSAFAVLIGLGAGAYSLWNEQRNQEIAAEQAVLETAANEVRIEGVLSTANVVNIPAPIEGILDTVMIDVGVEVYENQLLAQVMNTEIEIELLVLAEEQGAAQEAVNEMESKLIAARLEASRAEADYSRGRDEYEAAQANATRQRTLYRNGATPRLIYQKAQDDLKLVLADFEAVEASWRQAENGIEYARRDLDEAKRNLADVDLTIEELNQELEAAQISSPVNGIVTGMAARQGQDIHPGMDVLFQIATDLSRMNVILEPSPEQMALLRPGKKVFISVGDLWDELLQGTVVEMNLDRTVVAFANPTPKIRPGLNATVLVTP